MDITPTMLEEWTERLGRGQGLVEQFPNGTTLDELYNAMSSIADRTGFFRMALFALGVEAAKELTANGVGVNGATGELWSPLMMVARSGDAETAEWLIGQGADLGGEKEGTPAMLRTAVAAGNQPVAEVLLAHGVEPDIFCAAGLGLVDRLGELIRKEAENIDSPGLPGSALSIAARNGRSEAVRMLLEAGVDVDEPGENGSTALHEAADAGCVDVVRVLLRARVDVNAQDGSQNTALHLAAERGDEAMTALLLRAHADPNARNFSGATPLHVAMFFGNVRVGELLVEAGADPGARDDLGQTPMDVVPEEPPASDAPTPSE